MLRNYLMGTKRIVPVEDKAKFFAAIAAGQNIQQACRIAGIHYNTGGKWLKKAQAAEAERKAASARADKAVLTGGGVQSRSYQALMEAIDLSGAIPYDMLSEDAEEGSIRFRFLP